MIYARVPIGGKVLTVKGEDYKELRQCLEKLQAAQQKPVTSIVTRSGERIEINSEEFFE